MMARSDDTAEVGCNNERRLCGLARDDDKEDLREDTEELFGHSVQAPIDVADDQVGGAADVEEEDGDGDENSAKLSHPSTSAVWLDFKKLFKKVNGKKVRYGAECIHCSKQCSALSSGGTGHLIRHRDKCPRRREKTCMSQSRISFNPDGSMCNCEYCPIVARTQLV
jgi:hypothetical protein